MTGISRRGLLRAGAAALATPAVLRAHDALASSGTVNVYAWEDYFANNTLLADFNNATGIDVKLATYGSNAEAEARLRSAGGKGIDVFFPSVDTGPNYYRDGLLQPIDERRFDASRVVTPIYRSSQALGALDKGRRYLVPFDWGTEGLTWDSTKIDKVAGQISYGDMWKAGLTKQVVVRPVSVFNGVALYLDATGVLPSNRGLDLYKSEADSRRVFEGCLAFINAHRSNIGAFWTDATEARAAFVSGGCTIGQTWDSTGILLGRSSGPNWKYGMPKEGGLGWTDTFAIPAGAANAAQAYELMNFLYQPENGALFTNTTGYNSCVSGSENYLSAGAHAAFRAAYPPGSFDKMFWWPIQTDFYARLRAEYAAKLTQG
ncbi:extracellular solute-binding protein [Ancylobacter terrae]|uniref:extracellular solute-binding protein n=1 Tax=Ancylobacter sp. sgz301288 TaxID=3342077 RepID=UPI00385E1886